MFDKFLLAKIYGGGTQIRTGDKGFAVLGLTTWLCRRKRSLYVWTALLSRNDTQDIISITLITGNLFKFPTSSPIGFMQKIIITTLLLS